MQMQARYWFQVPVLVPISNLIRFDVCNAMTEAELTIIIL